MVMEIKLRFPSFTNLLVNQRTPLQLFVEKRLLSYDHITVQQKETRRPKLLSSIFAPSAAA